MSANISLIYQLIKNTGHHDNDTRYMATHDLITELDKVDVLEQSLQVRIRQAIIAQLDDKNTDVQTVAVRCLSTLVQKFDGEQVADIVGKLGSLVADAKQSANRDVYGIGLRTAIVALKPKDGKRLAGELTKHLLRGLNQEIVDDGQIHAVCLDILKELLARLGSALSQDYESIAKSLMELLESKQPSLQKRASFALGELGRYLGEESFKKIIDFISKGLNAQTDGGGQTTNVAYLQTTSLICQSAGTRVGRYLSRIVPALERTLKSTGSGSGDSSSRRDELWASCLQAYESMIRECPSHAAVHLPTMLPDIFRLLGHDPNYSYEAKEGIGRNGDPMEDDDDGDWGDDEEFGELSEMDGDDSDNSWKVRRAAARAVSAFVQSMPSFTLQPTQTGSNETYLSRVLTCLAARMKERDSGVKAEIMKALSNFLREISNLIPTSPVARTVLMTGAGDLVSNASREFTAAASDARGKGGQPTMRSAILDVFKELFGALASGKGDNRDGDKYIAASVDNVLVAILDPEPALVLDALTTLRVVLDLHPPLALIHNAKDPKDGEKRLQEVVGAIVQTIQKGPHKVRAEALRTSGSLVRIFKHALGPASQTKEAKKSEKPSKKSGPWGDAKQAGVEVGRIFSAVFAEMNKEEVDLEVREMAISSMTQLLASLGDHPMRTGGPNVEDTLALIAGRLKNEVTRMVSLRALTTLIASPNITPQSLLSHLDAATIRGYLRNTSILLRRQSLHFLSALAMRAGATDPVPSEAFVLLVSLIEDVASHVSETDLYLARLAVDLLSQTLVLSNLRSKSARPLPPSAGESILVHTLRFLRSPLIQGEALAATVRLFEGLVSTSPPIISTLGGTGKTGSQSVLRLVRDRLMDSVDSKLPSRNYAAIAKCLSASIIAAAKNGKKEAGEVATGLADVVKAKLKRKGPRQRVALLALGECVRFGVGGKGAAAVAMDALVSDDEEVRMAGATALGSIYAGEYETNGLTSLTQAISKNAKKRYLLLCALKRALECLLDTALSQSQSSQGELIATTHALSVAEVLGKHADAKEEGVRALVAECFGALLAAATLPLAPRAIALANSSKSHREMVLASLRHALLRAAEWRGKSNRARAAGDKIVSGVRELMMDGRGNAKGLVALFEDEELSVRVHSMTFLHATISHHPTLFQPQIARKLILPAVYKAITPEKSHVRMVDFGPFRHKVDDGLPLRKAGFRALGALLSSAAGPDGVLGDSSTRFQLGKLAAGLADEEADVQILAWRVLQDVARSPAAQVLLDIADSLPGSILGSIKKLLRQAKGSDQAAERARDVLRECVRGLRAVSMISGADRCSDFVQFFERVKQTSLLVHMLKDIERDEEGGSAGASVPTVDFKTR
ncbi:hypothetical protein AAMO2058_000601000 [Amorphochlora amoebiformis]